MVQHKTNQKYGVESLCIIISDKSYFLTLIVKPCSSQKISETQVLIVVFPFISDFSRPAVVEVSGVTGVRGSVPADGR